MINLTLNEFLKQLASSSATPGGGSTAALTGALGCALVEMTNNLTIGKEAYKDVEARMREDLETAVRLRTSFTELINEDIKAFNQLMAKYKLPKQSEEEKKIREAEIEKALLKAAEVPLQVARRSVELLKIAQVSAEMGNKNVVSDAVSGALLAYAALQIGVLNVKVNVDLLKDSMVAAELESETKNLLKEGKRVVEAIIEKSGLSALATEGES
ncbi:MAG TPA: cyclodeaminase/cyclohydrolase family protein [Clostridia bacterium]|jgi:glutamate formiminotransferase/formiminotetrahydrofolate cyclodeaminase|nr:cyclodeaminase/cyclohydrolase family protein [Clostridia bacterium]